MEENQTMNDSIDTTLDSRLRAVWRREQLLLLTRGGLSAVRWGLALFLAGVLIDWLIELPAVIRVVILLAVTGGTLFMAWKAGWRGVRRFEPVRTALQVESLNGGMESLLVSAVQLRKSAPTDALVQLICGKAEKVAETIRPGDAVKLGVLKRPAAIAAAVVLLLVVLSMTTGELLTAGLGRIFTPWAAIDYPTRTQLKLAEGDFVVREGSPVQIVGQVSKVIPREASIAVRTGTGKPIVRSLPITDGRCEYAVDTAYRSFEYQVKAGDARSPWHRVKVIQAPIIRKADVTLELPEYMQRPPETVDALTLTVPETTKICWKLTLDRAVSKAILNVDGQEPVPMEISNDGMTVSHESVATETRSYHFSWVDRDHGFSFSSLNYYLQVAPDRAPRVELLAPAKNIYATLGRVLKFSFRANDDHGIGESAIAFRIDKTEETKVPLTAPVPADGSEQVIDWDYRQALPDLAIGQTVSFAVEVADRFPGAKGPHRARSESRWIQFMSREEYLAQVEKQKVRQLSELKAIYREQRKVHEDILRLDPADPVFMQSCQLEAVRQDLMRERLNKLSNGMQEIIDDLAANQITDYPGTDALAQLRKEVLRISEQNLAATAPALRTLGGEAGKAAPVVASAKAKAVAALDDSAREIGLLVLQLGYNEAADVMAREYRAAAATQAALRLRTIVQQENADELAAEQDLLAAWLKRLFAASPKDRESTMEEALTAFTLSRVVKKMVNDGMEQRLQQASDLIRRNSAGDAAKRQAEVIQALLNAESRLRVGGERDALVTAKALYETLVAEQAKMRLAMDAVDDKTYRESGAAFAAEQEALHRKLQMLLMPQVPARRPRLFDDSYPLPPPVADLLATADDAMKRATAAIAKGERDAARKDQEMVEKSFKELAGISSARIAAITQILRITRFKFTAEEMYERFARYSDGLLALLEETEDAAADKKQANSLADRQTSLADTIQQQVDELNAQMQDGAASSEQPQALPACLAEIAQSLRIAAALLDAKKPEEAIPHQESALENIKLANALLADHAGRLSRLGGVLLAVESAEFPSPFIAEIIAEQADMLEGVRKSKDDELPGFAVSQKNLVHAVNATLELLAVVAKKVGSGTVMMFAKEDMEAAAAAMLAKDRPEAIDAMEYIIETMEKLRGDIVDVVAQHRYVLEIMEASYEASNKCVRLAEAQRRLRGKALAADADAAALAREQAEIKAGFQTYGASIEHITGLELNPGTLASMAEAESALARNDIAGAAATMQVAETSLKVEAAALANCVQQVGLILGAEAKKPEPVLMMQVLAVASKHKGFFREHSAADGAALKATESGLRGFGQSLDPFIVTAQEHLNPIVRLAKGESPPVEPLPPANLHLKLVAAKQSISEAAAGAAAGDRARTASNQEKAATSLRHFIIEYAIKFLAAQGSGAPPPPPAESEVFTEKQDELELFMPGAVSGERPADGKTDWEVLGKRQRAALNENFARELPLEHRDTLKNYFERLTK
jgi:hypothetical protein